MYVYHITYVYSAPHVYMYIRKHVCIHHLHVYMYIRKHVCIHHFRASTYTYMHAYIHTYSTKKKALENNVTYVEHTYIHTYIHSYKQHVKKWRSKMDVNMRTPVGGSMDECIGKVCECIYMHMHVYMYVCLYVWMLCCQGM